MSKYLVILFSYIISVNAQFPVYMEAEVKFDPSNPIGLSGSIIFSQFNTINYFIDASLSGADLTTLDWYVNTIPSTSSADCLTVGTSDISLGQIQNGNISQVDTLFQIRNSTGILGKSLVVIDNTNKLCAVALILPKGPKIIRSITYFNHLGVSGYVEFYVPKIQTTNLIRMDYPVIIHGKFEYFNSTQATITTDHDWHIHARRVTQAGVSPCIQVGQPIIGSSSTLACSPSDPSACSEGDLGGKFGRIDLAGEYVFTDPNLHFPNGLTDNFVIHKPFQSAERLTCSYLNATEVFVKDAQSLGRTRSAAPGPTTDAGPIVGGVFGALFGLSCVVGLVMFFKERGCPEPPKRTPAVKKEPVATQEPAKQEINIAEQSPTRGAVRGSDGQWRAQS